MAEAHESRTGAAATRGRSTVLGRVDAFLQADLDRDEIQAWLPELRDCYTALREPYERNLYGIHSRPDPAYAQRLSGLLELFSKAEVIEVYDGEGELHGYALTGGGP